MKPWLAILFACFVLLTLLHYRRYRFVQRVPDVLQINAHLHHSEYKHYFRENIPVIFLNHTASDIRALFSSSLTISTRSCTLQGTELGSFHTHRHDLLFLSLTEQSAEAVVHLSPPPSKSTSLYKWGKLSPSSTVPGMTLVQSEPTKAVQVLLRPGTILCLPRFWRVQIVSPVQATVTWTNTPFSWMFQKLVSHYV